MKMKVETQTGHPRELEVKAISTAEILIIIRDASDPQGAKNESVCLDIPEAQAFAKAIQVIAKQMAVR